MQVSDGMSREILIIGPDHTLHEAAAQMSKRRVGAALVLDGEEAVPGIITERDILDAVGAGQDTDKERVAAHVTRHLVVAGPDWSLEQAATAMLPTPSPERVLSRRFHRRVVEHRR